MCIRDSTWTIVQALTSVNEMTNDDVDAQLAKKETTENREFAYGARASMATAEAKEWAWDQALHNDELTNSQLEAVARGFSATPRSDLDEPFAAKYFETVDWVWANKTYHMADALLNGLYPGYADPATLVKLGDAWLDEHIAADNALKRLIVENVASCLLYTSHHRTLYRGRLENRSSAHQARRHHPQTRPARHVPTASGSGRRCGIGQYRRHSLLCQ